MGVLVEEMTVTRTDIDGLLKLTAKAVTDERGTVREFFRTSAFEDMGDVPARWAQMNMTWTHRGGLRGMHGEAMTKLVGVASGEAFAAYLDARPGSATYGTVVTAQLLPGVQLLIPQGVLNGFQAVSDPGCQYVYCFDAEWQPGMAGRAVTPLDPDVGIPWPIPPVADDPSMISAKDAAAPLFAELS